MNASLFIGLAWFACAFLAILAALRVSRSEPAMLVVATPLAVYVLGLAAASMTSFADPALNFWIVSIVYWFLVLSFLMAFGAIYKSLSLRMLLSLLEAEARTLDDTELAERYIKQQSFQDRLGVMVDKRLAVIQPDGRVVLTPRGRSIAQLTRRIQNLYRIEKSG
ncbi:hypothetical protein [Bosea sp. R86505]|uniref:hypothetical protein n=1 Tax=Bosea sp. R86505 TaxID=3101710 RepID=UPI003671D5F2